MRERARPGLRAAAVTLIAALLLPGGAYAEEQQPADSEPVNPAVAVFDVGVLRPLGMVALTISAVLFGPVALITAPGGKHSIEEALELFVMDPARNVFQRPIGEF